MLRIVGKAYFDGVMDGEFMNGFIQPITFKIC